MLKIDRSFVSALPGPESVAVVRAILAMASALGLNTVAEGVEETGQLGALRELGADRVQGFLLARPMELDALVRLLRGPSRQAVLAAAVSTRAAMCAARPANASSVSAVRSFSRT